jgi:DNA-binding transcriptional ArsR family regulator
MQPTHSSMSCRRAETPAAHHDVRHDKSSAGLQNAEGFGHHPALVGSEIDHAVRDDQVNGVRWERNRLDVVLEKLDVPNACLPLVLAREVEPRLLICVCNIHECLGIPQPTASRHLAYLRRKRLVVTRKDGLWVHYTRVLMNAVMHVAT